MSLHKRNYEYIEAILEKSYVKAEKEVLRNRLIQRKMELTRQEKILSTEINKLSNEIGYFTLLEKKEHKMSAEYKIMFINKKKNG